MVLYLPNFSLVFLIHVFLYAGVYCMRRANQAIVRERHPIPTIDDVLYQLNGSTVFSKLDLRQGLHQIELEEQSRKITTFITHKGLFRYKRLMFGISSAPELYQHTIEKVLEGCEGAYNIHDDIIIHSRTVKEHDVRLKKTFERIQEKGLTLNRDKCVSWDTYCPTKGSGQQNRM